ncbi:hypothetical protein GCM10022291_15630 [Postechiella marina]|uniref:Uncharacterized protein n=1 Tax=Postechiella marina TaxID=943941 RepID=A0ABP8C7Y2_9FLAO
MEFNFDLIDINILSIIIQQKAKIAILLIEVGVLAYALATTNEEQSKNKRIDR